MKTMIHEKDGKRYSKNIKIFNNPNSVASVSSEMAWKILQALNEKPMYPNELARKLKIHEQKIYYHVNRMLGAGLIEVIKEAHVEVFQKPTFKLMMPATSDARYFRNDNIQECKVPSICDNTVLFGGGVGTLAHAKNECIGIKTLMKMTKIYALIATKYLS